MSKSMSESWNNMIKKNNNINIKKKKAKIKIKKVDDKEEEYYNLFDFKYNDDIFDINTKFKKYINKKGLPFFENECFYNTIYDFIKYNSYNYDNIIKEIDSEEINEECDEYIDENEY
jgi:hypothetical protein